MQLKIILNANLKRYYDDKQETEINIPDNSDVTALIKYLKIPEHELMALVRNSKNLKNDDVLVEGDIIALIPSIAGG